MSKGCRCFITRFLGVEEVGGTGGTARTGGTSRTTRTGGTGSGKGVVTGFLVGGRGESSWFTTGEALPLYPGKKADSPVNSLVIASILSCFFMVNFFSPDNLQIGEEDLPDEFVVGKGCFGTGVKRKDIGLVEMGIPKVGITGDDGL